MMDWETILAFGLLFLTLISFVLEKVSVDVTALTLLGIILVLAGLNISRKLAECSGCTECFFK